MELIKVKGYTLSDEQTIPIINNDKYELIIAGAGSGKSLMLVGKVKYLLEKCLFKPNEICCLTFTNEAVNSLKNKIKEETNIDIEVYTFHKLALNIIKKSNKSYEIIDPNTLINIIDTFFNTKCMNNKLLINYLYKYYKIRFINKEKRLNNIINSNKINKLKKNIHSFLTYILSSDISFPNINKLDIPLILSYAIYNIYISELNSSNYIDFNTMLSKAKDIIDNKKLSIPYKIFIVDEFQDTSKPRFDFLLSLSKVNNAYLTFVGDDFQSIYGFEGTNLDLFINLNKYLDNLKIYYLNKTFRNSNELIQVAGSFVMKNSYQIKKNLISDKRIKYPIEIIYFSNYKTILNKVFKLIPLNKEVMILGRNNYDINKFNLYNIKHNYKYYTVHKSKGLESDYVILINMQNSMHGFPTKINNKLLGLVKDKESYPYEEERRLFYVGLTRTKNKVYILVNRNNPSVFIKEIKNNRSVKIRHFY